MPGVSHGWLGLGTGHLWRSPACLGSLRTDLNFNMAEAYAGDDSREAHVAAFLDLLELRYTGAGPQGLFLAQDKALANEDGSA